MSKETLFKIYLYIIRLAMACNATINKASKKKPTLNRRQKYLKEAITILKEKSAYADKVNWEQLEERYIFKARDAQKAADVNVFISEIIQEVVYANGTWPFAK